MKKTRSRRYKTSFYILKAILFCIAFTGIFMIFSFAKSWFPEKFERLAYGVIGTIAAFLTTWLFLLFDKKKFADIGLKYEKTTIGKFFFGVVIGMAIMGIMTFSVIYFSDFKVETNGNSGVFNFLLYTVPYIPLAFMEELGFRAYPLITIRNRVGSRDAIILTSILFAAYHIANGWTIQDSLLGAGVWGIIYGLAAVYSKGIAMPTGLHYAANLTTDAFGTTTDSFNIWVLKFDDGTAIVNHQTSPLMTIVPQIVLLVVGVICMEYYVMTKNTVRV